MTVHPPPRTGPCRLPLFLSWGLWQPGFGRAPGWDDGQDRGLGTEPSGRGAFHPGVQDPNVSPPHVRDAQTCAMPALRVEMRLVVFTRRSDPCPASSVPFGCAVQEPPTHTHLPAEPSYDRLPRLSLWPLGSESWWSPPDYKTPAYVSSLDSLLLSTWKYGLWTQVWFFSTKSH